MVPGRFHHRPQRKGRELALAGVLGTLLLPLAIQYIPFLFNQMQLVDFVKSLGLWGTITFILLHIVATILGVPGIILTIVGGVLFGLFWGSVLSLVGATLGAIGAFWAARYLLSDWAQGNDGQRTTQHRRTIRNHRQLLDSFNQAVLRHPFSFVLMVRFAPISPFNLVNFLFGMTPIHWLPYSMGTLIGIIPGVIAYTWVGVAGNDAMQGKGSWPLIIACICLAVLSAMPLLLRKKRSFTITGD